MGNTTSLLADFIVEADFQDIPQKAVEEAKRLLIDSIGCAFGAVRTQKGKICMSYAKEVSWGNQATVIGFDQKASASIAAFINGELFNTLDFDPLFHPFGHITPYVLPAVLSLAELKRVSGQTFITAIVLAHEIAQRISTGLVISNKFAKRCNKGEIEIFLPIHGYGVNIFGAIAGAGKILGLSKIQLENAMGIGGYSCPIPTIMQFCTSLPSPMTKFSPAGWISQGAVTASFLSEMGYTGDRNVLDAEYGFWRSFGADGWRPESVIKNLGNLWYLAQDMITYKRYPCCGAIQGAIDILNAIIKKFSLRPENIKRLNVVLNLLAELPLWKNRTISNQIEAQFSASYIFSVVCHQVEVGYRWQLAETYTNPRILEFMKRVNIVTPANLDYGKRDCMVEVIAEDKDTKKESRYTERDVWPLSFEMSEEELIDKFRKNVRNMLPMDVTEKIIGHALNLDKIQNICDFMALLHSS